jgi:cytochrome P450
MRRGIFINSPSLVDRMLRDKAFYRTDETRKAMDSFLGPGLFWLEDTAHLRRRRLMAPAFHRQRIARYGEMMAQEAERMLAGFSSGEVRDLRADMTKVAFAMISRALFHSDNLDRALEVGRYLDHIMPWAFRGARMAAVLPKGVALPYPKQTRKAITSLRSLVGGIVRERRASNEDREDILSMLISARDEHGEVLSDDDVCAEALTLLVAGHETSAVTLGWAWYLLARHPEIQEAVAREVTSRLGGRPPSADDLPHLPLVQQVVRETMRLYPAAWIGDRTSQQDTELAGFRIRAGTLVVFSVYVMQRDTRFFAQPETFDPDRFSPTRAPAIPPGAFLPFGAGTHLCIGNAFATMQAQLMVAAMAQRFRFVPISSAPAKLRPDITLNIAGELRLKLEARKEHTSTHGHPSAQMDGS